MTRQPINWNRDALESVRETIVGVLILVGLPASTIVIAAIIGGAR